ncbi:MAG TPA: type II secretion system F family protein [Rugosimonospora sp.]|nr:type II secretion system F family protein [Rugosimonospora sp.]
MILQWQQPVGIIGGGLLGAGVFLFVRELLPATPALGPALRRLQAEPPSTAAGTSEHPRLAGATRLLRIPERELALLGRTREQYVVSLLVSGLIGLALPPLLGIVLAVLGISFGLVIPAAAGLAAALLFILVAHRDIISKAERARREFRRAVCTYLDLTALQLSAAHGPVQALEQAATVCQGWVFERIREALLRAQMQLRFPWQELREMADRIGVPELGDIGATMQTSGTEGAQVQHTLRQQADSLRDQIRTDALARAESVTSRLDIPGAALVFVLVAAVLYPFMTRL